MRVFGYSRVSTSEQADEGASLAAQQQQIAGYAMMKGWTVAEHFVERAVSGSTPLADRPEGKRLLSTIGRGDVVVSAKLDRAFRSAADALAVLEELKDQGVGLHLIDLGGDVCGNGIQQDGVHDSRCGGRGREGSDSRAHPRRQAASDVTGRVQRRFAPIRLRHRAGWRRPAHGPQRRRDGGDRTHEVHAAERLDLPSHWGGHRSRT